MEKAGGITRLVPLRGRRRRSSTWTMSPAQLTVHCGRLGMPAPEDPRGSLQTSPGLWTALGAQEEHQVHNVENVDAAIDLYVEPVVVLGVPEDAGQVGNNLHQI